MKYISYTIFYNRRLVIINITYLLNFNTYFYKV